MSHFDKSLNYRLVVTTGSGKYPRTLYANTLRAVKDLFRRSNHDVGHIYCNVTGLIVDLMTSKSYRDSIKYRKKRLEPLVPDDDLVRVELEKVNRVNFTDKEWSKLKPALIGKAIQFTRDDGTPLLVQNPSFGK